MVNRAVSEIERAWAALDAVTDPEIPVVTIRELGILRDVRENQGELEIVITPTYSGCPAMEQIAADVHTALASAQLKARITTQLAPAWTTDWMSESAKTKLRDYGIAPPQHSSASPASSVVQFAPKMRAVDAHSVWAHGHFSSEIAIKCPHCGSDNTTETSHFASTACKALYKCLDCLEPFDYFKPY
jgi:ring-1,2-phenylacetyl-CoA epoxidase subunit PaaD